MNFTAKKASLIALACGAVFATPYAAADSMKLDGHALTINGQVAAGFGREKADGATAGPASDTAARNIIFGGQSYIRFSSSYKTSGPFTGIGWQIESAIDWESGVGTALGTRNTGVGMRTAAGDFWVGFWDTPYKEQAPVNFNSSSYGQGGGITGIIHNIGMRSGTGGLTKTTGLADTTNFDRRQANELYYQSPEFSNTQVTIAYSPDDNDVGAGVLGARPSLWSAGIAYENGPLAIGFAWERHSDFLWGSSIGANNFGIGSAAAGTGTSSRDTGVELGGTYKFGNTSVALGWERLTWTQGGGTAALTSLQSDHWSFGVQQDLGGPHQVALQYIRAGSYDCNTGFVCGTSTGAYQITPRYTYKVDKNSSVTLLYSKLSNDRDASYRLSSGSAPAVANGAVLNAAGLSYSGYTIVVRSKF